MTDSAPSASGSSSAPFDPKRLVSASGDVADAARYQTLIDAARKSGQQQAAFSISPIAVKTASTQPPFPSRATSGTVLAVLTVAISRGGMVQAQQHIRAIAYGVAAGGILFAIACSLWIAARVSRPIEQLAHAAEEVAGGNWETRVPERGRDEVACWRAASTT